MSKMMRVAALLAAAGLSGCSSPEETEAFCAAFADTATLTLSCNAGCTVPANDAAADDGNLGSGIAIAPVPGQTTATLTLTITNGGIDLPAGAVPGLFVTRPASGTRNTVLTSYDGGVLVDTSENDPQRVLQSVESGSAAASFLGLRTDDDFDEVRFTTSYDWDSDADAPTYFLYEVCSHGGND